MILPALARALFPERKPAASSTQGAQTFTPSAEQLRAIRAIADWYLGDSGQQVFYMAGYAGAGKTAISRLAAEEISRRAKRRIRVLYGAYTGKAADVLRSKAGVDADTIHRLIYKPVEDKDGHIRFELNPESPVADCDLLALDECSMIGDDMAADLLRFGVKLLVLGDPGQLPPVSGTSPFLNRRPDVFLTEIHRQAADNPIIRLATDVRMGRPIRFGEYGPGVRRVRRNGDAASYVLDAEAQVICGVHRVRWSATRWLRAQRGLHELLPVPGERLICRRNQHQLGLYNGTSCTLVEIGEGLDRNDVMLSVRLEDGRTVEDLRTRTEFFREHNEGQLPRPREFYQRDLSHFDFGYILSCHQAQGSSWPRVTVLDDSQSFRKDHIKWLYTAVTRAEDELTIVSAG